MRGNWDESARVPHQQLDAGEILRVLLAHEVEFLVIGSFAVAAHGYPHATKDIDIIPGPDGDNLRRLYEALVALEADLTELPRGVEDGNWTLRTRAGRIDVLQRVPSVEGAYESLRPNALEDEVPGVGRVLFAGYDDLVRMKLAAGRPADQLDLLQLKEIREDPEA